MLPILGDSFLHRSEQGMEISDHAWSSALLVFNEKIKLVHVKFAAKMPFHRRHCVPKAGYCPLRPPTFKVCYQR
jgi:hypothetical protein